MKKQILSVLAATTMVAQIAAAGDTAPVNSHWLRVESEANLDYFAKDSQNYETNLRLQDLRVRLTGKITKHVKAVLTTQIERMLIENGVETSGATFDVERFVEEAYIEVSMNEQSGVPVAVLIGKQAAAFGQQASRLPMFKDNLLYNLTRHEQVIGVSVKLEAKWLEQVLGSLEVSVFDNTQYDLKLGDAAGASIRLSRAITSKLKATASAMAIAKDNNYNWSDADKRITLGFVYDNGKGSWKTYAEGIYFEGNTAYPNSNWGAQIGAAKWFGFGEAVVEYQYLENVAHEIAAAYNIPVGKNLVVSPEVRYQRKDDGSGDDDTRLGVRTKVRFDSHQGHKN